MRIIKPELLASGPDAQRSVVAAHRSRSAELNIEPHGPRAKRLEYADEVQAGSLIDYWRILYRRKGALIAVAAAGILAGILVTLSQSPIYRAHTSLEIEDLNQDFLNIRW